MDPGFYVYFVNEEKTMIDAAEKDELVKLQKLYDVLENEKKELREKYNHAQNRWRNTPESAPISELYPLALVATSI